MSHTPDAIVVGSGPNGLTAAVELQRHGHSVLVLEARDTIGGGTSTEERTLPGFHHDVCSAIHPLGILSPYLRSLPLAEHGLEWLRFPVSVGHPLDDGPAGLLVRDLGVTGERLGEDARRWRRAFEPFLAQPEALFADLLGPVGRWPRDPLAMLRFGLAGLRSARGFAARFRTDRARALFAGCAGHSVLPLELAATAAVGMVFCIAAHVEDWPCARGGSASIARALAGFFEAEGGTLRTGERVQSLEQLPDSEVVLFDLSPKPFLAIAANALPSSYVRRLLRFRYGPGTFKMDWALDGPIPWRDARLAEASTVHVGGTFEEIAASERDAWEGRLSERPFLILCQQSAVDGSRAPHGQHTGYAYCHVPAGCAVDRSEAIEAQVERFAPGFRDRILARRSLSTRDFEALNPNYVGGAVTGGAATWDQLFTRPVARIDPYATPNPRLFLCGASTPPGGGVHGMAGYWAARSAMRRLRRR